MAFNETRQSWREKEYTVAAGKVLEIDFIDSNPNYCIVYNKSLSQLFVSRYSRCSSNDYDFTVPPNSNRQWGWAGNFKAMYIYNPSTGPVNILLTTYNAQFDPNSVPQTGDSIIVANSITVASMPGVTIENANVPVSGDVGIAGTVQVENKPGGTLNIGGQVNAIITSGTVNAVIQNATINAEVTNVILNKPIPNQAIYFSIPLEFLVDNEIIAPDVTKNILELHIDIRNDGTGSQRVPQTMGRQSYARHLANPTVAAGTSVREDLSFGPSGIGLDYGIFAACDITNNVWIEGYAIINSKN